MSRDHALGDGALDEFEDEMNEEASQNEAAAEDTAIDNSVTGRHNPADSPAAASRRWRSLWRLHFYSGIFAVPFILLMALTGLVILYTQPIQDLVQGDLRTVDKGDQYVSYDQQALAAEKAAGDAPLVAMIPPSAPDRSTTFWAAEADESTTELFVDPYTGKVLGSADAAGGIVGLSNRLHGYLNLESVTIPLPTVSALWDGEAVMRDYVVGDLILELLGVWTLVLVLSGLYLWWPRRSRAGGPDRTGRGFFTLRWSKGGRARWRDAHGIAGVIGLAMMLLTLISGFGWSTYWGPNFGALAHKLTPNTESAPPASVSATRGDLDRLGNKIAWNTGDIAIPASYATATDGSVPAPVSLDKVVSIAAEEKMLSGYLVNFPANSEDEAGNPVYGTYTLSNSWPRATGEARDVYIDQFTGKTLGHFDTFGFGAMSYGMDVLVSTHMGAQLGLLSRILMTALCVLSIWSVVSALIMYSKRRRGTLGLPRRPANVSLAPRLGVLAVGLGVIFPQWAASALIILGLDRFVIRKVPRLRRAFGQA